ncbi:MAG: glycoside hydrolase family 32 protein, partial [Turicibacter sp.]
LISEDMVHWQELELALESEKGKIDQDGCWSGTCCVDECGIPTIFYTAGDDRQYPNQMVAIAKSDYLKSGDVKLTKWQKQNHPIVKQTQEVGWFGEFRDPFVWKEDHSWYMLIGTGDANNGGGNAVLYTSVDMQDWIYRGFIMNYDFLLCQEVGHVWELPVLLPIRNSENEITKHILCFCSCQIDDDVVETYYFEGHWDKENYQFVPDHVLPKLIDLGYGTFTGGSGFVTIDKRSVFFTIAQGKRHFKEEYCSGWAHNGGLPIELFAHEDGCLGVRPIKELENLRCKKHLDIESVSLHDVNEQLKLIKSNMLELKVTVVLDQSEFGLGVCYDEGKRLHVYYEKQFYKYGVRNELGEIGRYRGEIDMVEVNSNKLTFTLYLDHSMVEVFLNEKKSMTLRQYSNQNNRNLKLFGEANQLIEKIEVWELDAI